MTLKDALKMLEFYIDDTIDHACYEEDSEFGVYPCCGEIDYKEHKYNCSHSEIKEALKVVKENLE